MLLQRSWYSWCKLTPSEHMLNSFFHLIYRCVDCIRRVWLSFVLSAYCLMLCIGYEIGVCIVVNERRRRWVKKEWKEEPDTSICTMFCKPHFIRFIMNLCYQWISFWNSMKHEFTLFYLNSTVGVVPNFLVWYSTFIVFLQRTQHNYFI